MKLSWRPSSWPVRARLTVVYGALFLASGAVLLTIIYVLLRRQNPTLFSFNTQGGGSGQIVLGGPPSTALNSLSPQALGEQLRSVAVNQRNATLRQLTTDSAFALGMMAVASMALGWLVAGRVLRPLRAMAASAQRVSEYNLHERLPASGPADELGELAATFNGVLARLESAFESQRQFVANASHELRTPLTLERAILEVALADPAANEASLRDACSRALAIGAQQETLIEALLTLARSQRGLDAVVPVDLASLVGEVVSSSPLVTPVLQCAVVAGDHRLLDRMVGNLVDNAVRYNVPDGWVRVTTGVTDGKAQLMVSNSGPVVPPARVPQLVQPFQRLSEDRTFGPGDAPSGPAEGLGVGLSIVAAIANAHRATLGIRARPTGGLDVSVVFPAA